MIQIIAAVFSAVTSMLAGKIYNIGALQITAGLFTITVFAVLLDVINELYGQKEAKKLVVGTLVAKILLYSYVFLAVLLPGKEVTPFNIPMMFAVKAALVSEFAMFITNYFLDIPMFNFMKRFNGGFFARTNLTNILSLSISTLIFMLITYYGKANLTPLITGQILIRLVMGFGLSLIATLALKIQRR
jgi:uncharacterized integral membrane protein (TIGR00697 family)